MPSEPIDRRDKTLLRQFFSSEHNAYVQFIKYGIGGCVATAVHIVVFFLAATFIFPAIGPDDVMARFFHLPATDATKEIVARNSSIDNFIAFLFSNLVAYLINVVWVFKPGRHRRSVEIAMFYLVSGVSIFMGTAMLWVLVKYFNFTTTIAFGANIVAAVMINYAMRKFVIFKG